MRKKKNTKNPQNEYPFTRKRTILPSQIITTNIKTMPAPERGQLLQYCSKMKKYKSQKSPKNAKKYTKLAKKRKKMTKIK